MDKGDVFSGGVFVGLLIGMGFTFIATRALERQADYWLENYCAEVLYDFCEDVLGEDDFRILREYRDGH